MRKLNSSVTTIHNQSPQLSYVCSQMQGISNCHIGWRPSMEDAHICGINNVGEGLSLFAVFDGHGGGHVSKYVEECFIEIFQGLKEFKEGNYVLALQNTFRLIDEKLLTPEACSKMQAETNKRQNINPSLLAGTTANVVLLTPKEIIVANCGDSRAALYIQKTKGLPLYVELSTDHKPDDENEKERITKAGGFVANGRVNANLSLSRALGDHYYKSNKNLPYSAQAITCHPHIQVFPRPLISPNQILPNFIVLGCDGIWERFEESSAGLLEVVKCNLSLGMSLSETSEDILQLLVSRNVIETKGKGCDNMSIIIIKFEP